MWVRRTLTLVGSAAICLGSMGRPQLVVTANTEERSQPTAVTSIPLEAPPVIQRPRGLVPLYISFATLQALDIHSTLRAPEFGAREANPIVGGMLGSPVAFVAVKAGMTAGIYFLSERLWKRNKTAAVLSMIALNSTYGAVVAHNYAVEAAAARGGSR